MLLSNFDFKRRVLLFVVATALIFVGCAKGSDQGSDNQGQPVLSGNLQLAGSTSVQPLAEELANAFMQKNPKVVINVQGGGSSAGIKAAAEGVADIGMASRDLKESEEDLGLVSAVIAKDGICVVLNPLNQVTNLTMEQIKKIFTGEITNWQEVGGTNASVVVINREEGSGTRGAFEEIVLGKEGNFTENAVIQNSTGAVRTAVTGDPNAIGYISMGFIDQNVIAVKVDGIDALPENVLTGTYKISRSFNFLTKGEATGLSRTFMEWVLSKEGQKVVAEGFIPVK